jgi:hypothetical protein
VNGRAIRYILGMIEVLKFLLQKVLGAPVPLKVLNLTLRGQSPELGMSRGPDLYEGQFWLGLLVFPQRHVQSVYCSLEEIGFRPSRSFN